MILFNLFASGQSDFIKNAVEVRLRMIIPYIDSWPQVFRQFLCFIKTRMSVVIKSMSIVLSEGNEFDGLPIKCC